MLNLFRKQFNESTNALALPHGQFITRDYTDASGQQFRLTFFVTIVGGEARGQLVSAQPISSPKQAQICGTCISNSFYLPCAPIKSVLSLNTPKLQLRWVSPFTELFFFTSQPTRAPSHI